MPTLEGIFGTPSIIFTLKGNPQSVAVLEALEQCDCSANRMVFDSKADVENYFSSTGISPASAVVLFDQNLGRKRFRPTCRNRSWAVKVPDWTAGAQWIVMVGGACHSQPRVEGCARQIAADFGKNFSKRLHGGQFPWGSGKKTSIGCEQPPRPISIPDTIGQIIADLNAGPNLAEAIADKAFAAELPTDSRISWIRVVPEPLTLDVRAVEKVLAALRSFEVACNQLVSDNPEVQDLLLAGVELPEGSLLPKAYLFPRVSRSSVGRPDLHYTGQNDLPFASEIDEMPGGMPELVHIDHVYGINAARWQKAFDWLCQEGKLLFLVSHQWSKCYIPETEWLVGYLQRLGYPVGLLTTDRIEEIKFCNGGLYLAGEKIRTIWRQFPIFETRCWLENVVMAAEEGRVRLFPEFAHFGNKAWFSVFRSHEAFYRKTLDADTFAILDQVLPHSYIVGAGGSDSFPFEVNGVDIASLTDLKNLPESHRDKLVLKICGANNLAARSYGVLMGVGIQDDEWKNWINERLELRQPFVVQRRLAAGIGRIPVMNTKTGYPELFSCRILARPWSFNGKLVSVHGCAVPSYLYRVHGMVDMAVVPFSI